MAIGAVFGAWVGILFSISIGFQSQMGLGFGDYRRAYAVITYGFLAAGFFAPPVTCWL
jgi:hypothetical protein